MGRVKYAARNILYGYLSNAVTGVLGIALQKIFIIKLGETLLGVNSTYTSILSVLSLAELGLGTAVNFSLYGPVARGDRETVMPFLPRFGLRVFLPRDYCGVKYLGYGPMESYCDKRKAARLGFFTSDVESLHEDYLRPQENGSHCGCGFVELTTGDGRSLRASGRDFSFCVSRYTQEELTRKRHNYELEESPYTVLCLDGAISGCGSNSCGPCLAREYQVNGKHLQMEYCFEMDLLN